MFLYHSRSAAIDIALIAIAVKRCYRSDSYLKLSLSQRSAAQVEIGLYSGVAEKQGLEMATLRSKIGAVGLYTPFRGNSSLSRIYDVTEIHNVLVLFDFVRPANF